MIRRFAVVLCLMVVVVLSSQPADVRLEKDSGLPSGLPKPITDALSPAGYRVVSADGTTMASVWFRQDLPVTGKKEVEGANYPQLTRSEWIGLIQLASATKDFRGQPIKPGLYSLRYELLPSDGNHLGVAPDRDFLLLVPAAADPGPAALPSYEDLVKLSSPAAGSNHPACFSMVAAPKAVPAAFTDANDYVILAAPVKTSQGELPLAVIVRGSSMSF